MRFRRRVKIMKGLSLNLSNSGLSLTAGVKGASINFGKRGTFLNTGIPGTGLYNRTQIDSTSTTQNSTRNKPIPTGDANVSIKLDHNGTPILTITDASGRPITNESILRKVKQTDRYKQSVAGLIENRKKEIDEETDKFINVFKYTPEIISESILKEELQNFKPQTYTAKEFEDKMPQKELVKQALEREAKQTINQILFWKNKGLRETYVVENLEARFKYEMDKWEKRKQEFTETEVNYKKHKDKEYYDEAIVVKTELEKILNGDENYIEERIDSIIREIILPVEFSLNYEYHSALNQLKIDIDLPEIENMPTEKANILSSGKISIRHKNQKEIKQEYAQCVCGIAFFLGGTFFNISPQIKDVIISGHTQRVNKATGNKENEFIYSIKFLRSCLDFI